MDEMNLADLVREISRSVQQTVSNNSKTFVEIRRTVDSTVKEIKDTVLETVDTVKNTARAQNHPETGALSTSMGGWQADEAFCARQNHRVAFGFAWRRARRADCGGTGGLRDPGWPSKG